MGLGKDALPDVSGEDDVHADPTKVGDRVAVPEENATSKMAPFQLEEVLKKARAKAPSLVPPAASDPAPVNDRVTVPGPVPGAESDVEPPEAEVAHASHHSAPPAPVPRDSGAIVSVLLAAIFVVLTCAVLLSR